MDEILNCCSICGQSNDRCQCDLGELARRELVIEEQVSKEALDKVGVINEESGEEEKMVDPLQEELARLVGTVKSGANWFYWMAALSMLNSVILMLGGDWSFLVGLGATSFIAAVTAYAGSTVAIVIGFTIIIFVNIFFLVLGLLSNQGKSGAFIVGMVIYALDALLCLFFEDYFGFAFHLFVLYNLFMGVKANFKLKKMLGRGVALPEVEPGE